MPLSLGNFIIISYRAAIVDDSIYWLEREYLVEIHFANYTIYSFFNAIKFILKLHYLIGDDPVQGMKSI